MRRSITLVAIAALALCAMACGGKKKTGTLCSSGSDCSSGICAVEKCVQALCSSQESSVAACNAQQTCVRYPDATTPTCVESSKVVIASTQDATTGTEDATDSGTRAEWVQKFCEASIKVCLETAPALDSCKKSFDDPSAKTPAQSDLDCIATKAMETGCETPSAECCGCWGGIFTSTP